MRKTSNKQLYSLMLDDQLLRENTVIRNFLEKEDHEILLKKCMSDMNSENIERLDDAFRHFFYKVKLIHYMTTMIQHHVFDIRKRYSRFEERNVLILDQQSDEKDINLLDYLSFKNKPVSDDTFDQYLSLIDCVSDKKVYYALKNLKKKQLKILDLFYIYGLKNREIAEYFGDTPQNISITHKNTLKIITKSLGE